MSFSSPTTVLEQASSLAVVGLSQSPWKAAYAIPGGLQSMGWRIIPVHPTADGLLGEKVYARLADIPEDVDLVVAFRPSAEAAAMARDAGITSIEDECIGALARRYRLRPAA